ncbi:MAG: sigma 54-interacting transcriptional regulator [Thermoanaerobaculia bacterium]
MRRESESCLEVQTWSTPEGEGPLPLTVPALTILAHPQAQRVGERAVLYSLSSGREVALSRREPAFAPPRGAPAQPLAVQYLSRTPFQLQPTGDGGIRLVRGESAVHLAAQGRPVEVEAAFSVSEVGRGIVLLLARRVALLLHRVLPAFAGGLPRHGLVGESDSLLDLCRQIARVADLDVPVLLRGESGTGKELVAAALHRAGRRRERPFLALNVGALPPALAAAELFGAVRGAFTGADHARRGYFRRAHGGTLFLDEIGETPPDVQPLLLRALESGEIQPLGSEETVRVDVRALAATDTDLEQAVAAGRFRSPLLHRLGGYTVRLPPLRERRDDIGRLLFHFLRQELAALGEESRLEDPGFGGQPWPPAEWVARLAAACWPGNVRQLRNVARALVVESRGGGKPQLTSTLESLFCQAESAAGPAAEVATADEPRRPRSRTAFRSPQEVSEKELLAALAANHWRPRETARQLGVSRPSLYFLLDAFPGAHKAVDLSRDEIVAAGEHCGGRLSEMAARLQVSEVGIRRRMKQLGLLPLCPSGGK